MVETESRVGQDTLTPDPASAREEAERLVAAGLAVVSMAADRIGRRASRDRGGAAAAGYEALGDVLFGPSERRRHSVANDSEECCRCPVCRVIAAARQPNLDFAERLAAGVGNVAEGAVRVLRTLAPPAPASPTRPGRNDDPWAAATAAPVPKPMAKKTVKKAVRTAKAGGARPGTGKAAPAKATPAKAAPADATPARTAAKAPAKRAAPGTGPAAAQGRQQ